MPTTKPVNGATIEIRSKYDGKSKRTVAQPSGLSRTKQSHKDECDINHIMRRYEKYGVLPSLIASNPRYGDFSSVEDYQTSLNKVMLANEMFQALPSKVRLRFNNDPQAFLAFAVDPKNIAEMREMGLAPKAAVPDRVDPPKPSPAAPNGAEGERKA